MDVDIVEIRSLLAELILEEEIQGQIDQVNGVLELNSSELLTTQKHSAMRKWMDTLVDVNQRLFEKVHFGNFGAGNFMDKGAFDEHDDDF